MKTNKKGISLIVLAITIIVMILLASAIVLSLTSSDIVDSAKGATNANNIANAKQLVMVAEAEWEMEEEERYDSFKEYAEAKLLEAGFQLNAGTGSIEVTEQADVYLYPTIPAGFVASQATGENTVGSGLVIYETTIPVTDENVETAQNTYNQYVWVPVDSISTFERVEWGEGVSIEETTSYDLNDAAEAAEYMALKESVEKYGGFYIARYEAGKSGEGTLTSKKNVAVWNNISPDDAKIQSSKLTTDSVVSHLIYGEEWDSALKFISKTDPTYPTDRGGRGSHASGSMVETGLNSLDIMNNIHDMAGNANEWTMETFYPTDTTAIFSIVRGYYYSGPTTLCFSPAGRCNNNYPNSYQSSVGFRVALYLK